MALPEPQSSDARVKRKQEPGADLWTALDAAVHSQNEEGDTNGKARAQRSHDEILLAAIKRVRALKVETQGVVQVAMLQVPKEAAVLVVHLPSCEIMHAGNGFDDLGRWMCSDGLRARHLTNLLHPDDAMQFKVFVGEVLKAVRTAPSLRAALASQMGKTQRVRMLRLAPPETPGGVAPDWALVYTPALTLTVARVDHTEKGELVAVFTADLRPADFVEIDTERCVASLHELIRAGRVNREYVVDWGVGGMNVIAFGSTYAGWGLGSKAVLGGTAGQAFAETVYRSLCAMASWMVKKFLSYRMAVEWRIDHHGRPQLCHVTNVRYVGGGGFKLCRETPFGKQVALPALPSPAAIAPGAAGWLPPQEPLHQEASTRNTVNFVLLRPTEGPRSNTISSVAFSFPSAPGGDPRRTVEMRVDGTFTPDQMTLSSFMPWATGSSSEDRLFGVGYSTSESNTTITRAKSEGSMDRWVQSAD